MTGIAKKRRLRRKYRKHLLSSFQKTKSPQASRSDFPEKNEQVEKTKYELELVKIKDCFLAAYGSYSRNFVSFENKFL